ncbi:hypothetical protein Bca4012_044621 [Brassica carinata]
MVSQIVWLGVKDVFTQIAKDVVGRRSLRGLIQNQCRVSCWMIACSDVTEGNEMQKLVSHILLRKSSYVYLQKFLRKTWSDCKSGICIHMSK